MVTTNDDPPEYLDEITTSDEQCRLNPAVKFLEELIYEVFLRLPVKSLIRFRCLSKGMRQLIDSPIFIKNHNIRRSVISVSDDEEYAIVLCQPRLHRLFSVNFDKDDNNPNLNRAKAIELNSTFAQEGKMDVMGWCCHGIFCFQNFQSSQCYVFWNPSNGTFRKVDCSSCLSSHHASMGYDCANDDYKIIRFIASETRGLEIYSFRKDSWRKIPMRDRDRDYSRGRYCYRSEVCLGGVIHCYTSEVCLGGVIHWLWTKRTDKSMFIAAFDLATETFTSLPLPLEARQVQLKPSHFTDFRGRLCVTFLPTGYPRHSHGPQTIWVMDKYGVESCCWSKLYNFDNTKRCIRNFYFPNMKSRLLCNFSWLSWWDPQDGSFEDIEIPGLLNDQALFPELYFYEAYVYVRNLVRLDQTLV